MSGTTWTAAEWIGSAEQCESIRQFARDYAWEGRVEDPGYAAEEIVAQLCEEEDLHADAAARLRRELTASAERANEARP